MTLKRWRRMQSEAARNNLWSTLRLKSNSTSSYDLSRLKHHRYLLNIRRVVRCLNKMWHIYTHYKRIWAEPRQCAQISDLFLTQCPRGVKVYVKTDWMVPLVYLTWHTHILRSGGNVSFEIRGGGAPRAFFSSVKDIQSDQVLRWRDWCLVEMSCWCKAYPSPCMSLSFLMTQRETVTLSWGDAWMFFGTRCHRLALTFMCWFICFETSCLWIKKLLFVLTLLFNLQLSALSGDTKGADRVSEALRRSDIFHRENKMLR